MSRGNNAVAPVYHQRVFERRGQRGVAMLVALFSLLLLSVVGLGMMYSTNMETAINANYRDKQNAIYAAMAGLQEARDRLRPYPLPIPEGRIVAPAGLPSLSAGNVIYIINPKTGETIQPWLAGTTNRYMDTELCQEHVLGLSATLGPCTTLPSGSSWYTVYDDSLAAASFWHLPNPLDFKWVRISLKTNNSTAVAANGDSSDSRQVCWDGARQLVLPSGYGPECIRFGSVIAITVTNPGTNYTSVPTVTIDPAPAGGINATATAHTTLTDAVVGAVNVTSQGSNYTSVPTVIIDPPGTGTQATAHVCVSSSECANPYIPPGAPVASVSVSSAGTTCYTSEPAVLFSGGGGSGTAATASLASGSTSCIVAWSVTGTCSAHKSETLTSVGLTGGGGSGFSGTLKFDSTGKLVTGYPTVQTSGTGYASDPTGMSGFTGCGSLTLSVTRGRRIASPQTITPYLVGSGYTSAPTVSFATGSGDSLPAGTATLGTESVNARKVRQIIMDNGGSGYMSVPGVIISGGGGTGAAAIATLASSVYKVSSITIDNRGSGYTTDPNVMIGGGGGTGATATATLGRGANYGRIYLFTALGQTRTGARAMLQMEATTALTGFFSTGALTIDGPSPSVQSMPNSMNFDVNGTDADSCGQGLEPLRPAIGGYDDPSADPPTHSVADIVDALPDDRLDHYIGSGGTPSVANVYEALGETLGTPRGLKKVLEGIDGWPHSNTGLTVDFGSPTAPAVNYIDGNVTLSGGTNGYGILAVTGRLQMNGNFTWHGPVLVIGDGILDFGGGGGGTIIGTVLVAKIWPDPAHHADADLLSSNGVPTINWNGGGGNSILYDHCWATNMMSKIPIDSPISLRPLKTLSFRSLPY
ncbi:MAG: hypothetical protein DMG14_03850 [Acidobacteria bacterium]|nr:MAG: hypothetical protein DMG14_03850 [Acidobacteriota bacterium]